MAINLFAPEYKECVLETNMTRKITLNGETKPYPVYKVRLDLLYYNDQNDRIATWINQYKTEHGEEAFKSLSFEEYNTVIEKFIIQSNPAAIDKTRKNISLVNQREPGVVLTDGRIIDGNRRFTCLRQLARNDSSFNWFETVILERNMEDSKKEIKVLELQIQHGEESKVDYNPMDRLIGVYQDVIETKLLSIKEYAEATNELESEVKKKIEQALLAVEFLEFIGMPKQYYVARDYQIGTIMPEIPRVLRKCETEEIKQQTKELIFTNLMMKSVGDNARYIRDIAKMMDNGLFAAYLKEQNVIKEDMQERRAEASPNNLEELEAFVTNNLDIIEDLKNSKEKALFETKRKETKDRPTQIVSKTLNLLQDVDTNIIDKMNDSEKETLKTQVTKLVQIADEFDIIVSDEDEIKARREGRKKGPQRLGADSNTKQWSDYSISETRNDVLDIAVLNASKPINNLGFSLDCVGYGTGNQTSYKMCFVNEQCEDLSDTYEIEIGKEQQSIHIQLFSKASSEKKIYLIIRYVEDNDNIILKKIPFVVDMLFSADFDF